MPSAWGLGTNTIKAAEPPVTVDLPAAGAPPVTIAEIDLTSNVNTVAVNVSAPSGAYLSWGLTSAAALANLGADATRHKLAAGIYSVETRNFTGVIGLTALSTAVTDGLSYHSVKG